MKVNEKKTKAPDNEHWVLLLYERYKEIYGDPKTKGD